MALAGLGALGWAGSSFAQTGSITTTCPTNFQCGFSAAETLPFNAKTPNQAGQPDVYVGYMAFDASGGVTLSTLGMLNGTLTSSPTLSGACINGLSGIPAVINFTNGPQLMFVTVNSAAGNNGEELDFILSKDNSSGSTTTNNSVRVGVCRSPAP